MNDSFIAQYTEFINSCNTAVQVDNLEAKIELNYGLVPEELKKVFIEKRNAMMESNNDLVG